MTVEEIFSQLINHLLSGMMVHESFANYYDFLGLKGYKECHEYHHFEETCSYRNMYSYYIEHFDRLIAAGQLEIPNIIPGFWYGHTRQEVDANTKKEGVKSGMNGWVNWERDTKKLYENAYNDLVSIGEIAASEQVRRLALDVDGELEEAESLLLNLSAVNYDLDVIIPEQEKEYKKYRKKIKNLDIGGTR